MREMTCEVLVVGGGLGGVAAALAAARNGRSVIVTEETDWLGGQLTSQGVPPDEHPWIEQFGCTATYRRLRDGIRAYYREWTPLNERARGLRWLNPGAGLVSKLCCEPRVGLAVIDAMLHPHRSSGMIRVLYNTEPTSALVVGDRVTSMVLRHTASGESIVVEADYVIDATELGSVLPLTGTEFVTGFESREETGEPSAPEIAQPANIQAISVCFAFDHLEGEDHVIGEPAEYTYWSKHQPRFWPGRQIGLAAPHPQTLLRLDHTFIPNPPGDPTGVFADQSLDHGSTDLWLFRRLLARGNFVPGAMRSDVVLANWPMLDYLGGPLFGVSSEAAAQHLEHARQQSLAMFYWLQTEVPRPDGGHGYPGLRMRGDVLGTRDGLAKAPYVRESRRIKAIKTVTEQEISLAVRGEHGAQEFEDSVGIGMYRIDLHPSTGGDNYIDVPSCPFQIPLRALIPIRVRNLLAAAKNIGTTHITNGAYRLHPIEWNIGEVAGLLAVHCLDRSTEPHAVVAAQDRIVDFQARCLREGIELRWPSVGPY